MHVPQTGKVGIAAETLPDSEVVEVGPPEVFSFDTTSLRCLKPLHLRVRLSK